MYIKSGREYKRLYPFNRWNKMDQLFKKIIDAVNNIT